MKRDDMLQWDFNVQIALAKIREFECQSFRAGELVRLGLLKKADAADVLQEAAAYNQLIFEYGADRIQMIMAAGLSEAA